MDTTDIETTTNAAQKVTASDWEKRWTLRFDCSVSGRYNQALSGFYRRINSITLLVSIFGSTAFFAEAADMSLILKTLFSLAIALFGIVYIVWQTGQRADFHANQYRRYKLLSRRFETDEDYASLFREYCLIEADETNPTRVNLHTVQRNTEAYVLSVEYGEEWYAKAYLPLKWWQEWGILPYLLDFGNRPRKPRPPAPPHKTDSGAHDTTQSK